MENAHDVYERLAAHLDRLPAGFPRTATGVELRILKRLFSPEDADLAQLLTLKPETVEEIAVRTGRDIQDIASQLEEMSRKGLIFRMRKEQDVRFMAAQFMVGFWEYHVNDLDVDLIKDVNEYFPYYFESLNRVQTRQLRTVPVSRALLPEQTIVPYEEARKIIAEQEHVTVAPCICRKEHEMVGKGCKKPMESCLIFGVAALYYQENGLGRAISNEEALNILETAEEAGLVLQPSNSQNAVNICTCCGCCCQILKNLKRLPKPAQYAATNYYAAVDQDECTGCEICLERCQMDAIRIDNSIATVDRDRCIGCGLCVPTCAPQALQLHAKSEGERCEPPVYLHQTYRKIAQERAS